MQQKDTWRVALARPKSRSRVSWAFEKERVTGQTPRVQNTIMNSSILIDGEGQSDSLQQTRDNRARTWSSAGSRYSSALAVPGALVSPPMQLLPGSTISGCAEEHEDQLEGGHQSVSFEKQHPVDRPPIPTFGMHFSSIRPFSSGKSAPPKDWTPAGSPSDTRRREASASAPAQDTFANLSEGQISQFQSMRGRTQHMGFVFRQGAGRARCPVEMEFAG